MSFTERRQYLALMYRRYQKASPSERSALLDEMEVVTGLHRKSLIRLMRGPVATKRKPRRKERGPVYGPEVRAVVFLIAQALDSPSAERLQPMLVPMATLLAQHGQLSVHDHLLALLATIRVSTVRRILKRVPRDKPRPPSRLRSPKPAILREIPAGRIPWDIGEPGHMEGDLVHHCGPSASGEYVCSLVMVDMETGWVELRHILGRIPFRIRSLHPDNGSEFLFGGGRKFTNGLSSFSPFPEQDRA